MKAINSGHEVRISDHGEAATSFCSVVLLIVSWLTCILMVIYIKERVHQITNL